MHPCVAGRVLGLLRGRTFERFRSALVWNIVGSVATQGGALAANLVVARTLGREAYGGFTIISSTMLTVAGIAQLATGFTATKFVAEFAATDPAKAGRVLGLCQLVAIATGLIASVALLVGARPLAVHVLHVPALAPQLAITAAFIFFAVIAGVLQGALSGLHAFRPLAIVSAVQGVLYVAVCWLGSRAFGLTGAVCAIAIGALVRWAFGFVLLVRVCRQRGVPIAVRGASRERQVLFGFAIPAALAGFTSLPALWAGNAILISQGGELAGMAYVGAAVSLKTLILFMPTVIDGVSTALINRERSVGDEQSYRQIFNLNLAVTGAVAGTLAIGVVLFARPLMALFGNRFVAGADVLRVLAVAACIQALMGPFYQLIQSQGRMWFSLFGVALPRDLLMVALALMLTPRHGALGLGFAQLLAWVLAFLVVFAATRGGRLRGAGMRV
jgi:O-antigen/teichoic acid export membrane protein